MALSEKTLTIEDGRWSDDVARLLAQALQHASMIDIKSQVDSGVSRLFEVRDGARLVGAFVLRVERLAERFEGVIVAAAGGCDGVSLTQTVLPVIERMFVNCETVRIHTARHGLAKMLMQRHGYAVAEMVLKKGIQ